MQDKSIITLATIIGGIAVVIVSGITPDFDVNESLLTLILAAGLSISTTVGVLKLKQDTPTVYTKFALKSSHSERAMRNMTEQVLSQLEFLEKNLEGKIANRDKLNKWRKYKLPGLNWMIAKHNKGIRVVEKDIKTLKTQIIKLQKEGKIFPIITVIGK